MSQSLKDAVYDILETIYSREGARIFPKYVEIAKQSSVPSVLPLEITHVISRIESIKNYPGLRQAVFNLFGLDLTEEEADFFLLYVGTISQIKNIPEMIAARDKKIEILHTKITTAIETFASILRVETNLESINQAFLGLPQDHYLRMPYIELLSVISNTEEIVASSGNLLDRIVSNLHGLVALLDKKTEQISTSTQVIEKAENYFKQK